MNRSRRLVLVLSALALLAGCGTKPGERVGGGAATGAGTGAVIGAIAGPPGAAVGAAVGAAAGGATGAVTTPSQVNLGRPPVPNTMNVGNTTVHP